MRQPSARLDIERLLTPAEVANLFHVSPKTVNRWGKTGKLAVIRTLGGHARYREVEVREALERHLAPRSEPSD